MRWRSWSKPACRFTRRKKKNPAELPGGLVDQRGRNREEAINALDGNPPKMGVKQKSDNSEKESRNAERMFTRSLRPEPGSEFLACDQFAVARRSLTIAATASAAR